MPGVVAIVTGADLVARGREAAPQSADFKRADGAPTAAPPQHALAVDTVRYVGEAVAAVVAETREQARDAAEAIDVRYEPLPRGRRDRRRDRAGRAARVAGRDGQRRVRDAARQRRGDGAAIAAAAHVVTLDLVNQRLAPAPIEPRATLASYDAGDRPHHAARQLPDADRPARRAVQRSARRSRRKDARRRRRRRRRLRHEDDALRRGRRRRVLRARARSGR